MKKLALIFAVLSLSLSAFGEVRKITVVNHQFEGTKQWLPGTLVVNQGDDVEITLINNVASGTHNFQIKEFKVNETLTKGSTKTVKFKASKKGIHVIDCGLHKAHVGGQLIVL